MAFGPVDEVSGQEMGSTGSFVAASGGREWGPGPIVRGTTILGPGGDVAIRVITFFFFFYFIQVCREGVSREKHGGDIPPAFSLMTIGTELVRRTRLRDVHGQKGPLGTSMGTRNKLIDK